MIMPFWVQCVSCSKWREFPEKALTTSAIASWKCSSPATVITSETKVCNSKLVITEVVNIIITINTNNDVKININVLMIVSR